MTILRLLSNLGFSFKRAYVNKVKTQHSSYVLYVTIVTKGFQIWATSITPLGPVLISYHLADFRIGEQSILGIRSVDSYKNLRPE